MHTILDLQLKFTQILSGYDIKELAFNSLILQHRAWDLTKKKNMWTIKAII